jgi:hypothetical protein
MTAGRGKLQAARPLADTLNEGCQCIWVDRPTLQQQLREQLGESNALLDTREGLVSGSVVFLGAREAAAMDRTIELVTRALGSGSMQDRVAGDAAAIARQPGPTSGGALGFDFHLGASLPQLIEINTNPGGLLISLELARAATASCDCLGEPLSMMAGADVAAGVLGPRIARSFLAEWTRARGDAPLRAIAIVDDDPHQQYLYPEFLLYQKLFERAGWHALIADPAQLTVRGGVLLCDGVAIDLVYNRLTDFYLGEACHAALRDAYEKDLAVVTPHPAAHARWADKRLLAWLTDPKLLVAAGLDSDEREHLLRTVPTTEIVMPSLADDLWRRRKELFFKPVDGFGGRGAYRGAKLTRKTFEHILAHRYVAQVVAATSTRRVMAGDGQLSDLRLDIRNYVVQEETWLRAARLYRGQTTNFRTAGGGFAPVLTLRA